MRTFRETLVPQYLESATFNTFVLSLVFGMEVRETE